MSKQKQIVLKLYKHIWIILNPKIECAHFLMWLPNKDIIYSVSLKFKFVNVKINQMLTQIRTTA